MLISQNADQALAGFMAGAVSTTLLHPLDLIKTQFQVNESNSVSLRSQLKTWGSKYGLKGLYRGLGPNFTGATLSWGLYFGLYSTFKESQGNGKLSPTQHLMASGQAGLVTSLFTNPIWLIKTRMCTQPPDDPRRYRGLFDGLRSVFKEEGVRGLYRGIVPAMFGVTHGAIQFMAYEELKHTRANFHGSSDKLTTLEYICMAVASKVIATSLTYPYQVVKSRMQVQSVYVTKEYNGVLSTISQVFKESPKSFYKGMGVNLIRVLPGTCITFAVYESLSKFFRNYSV